MVSKEKYHEWKTHGLCVKCGADRTNSSTVRCLSCNEKYLAQKSLKKEERLEAGVCVQCGSNALLGNSKYCNLCREKNNNYKNKIPKPLSVYKESNSQCKLCDGVVDTLGIVCQKCLDQVVFTKADAITRYGGSCIKCNNSDYDFLVIASSDITAPMTYTGPELYRHVCFSSSLPKNYRVICSLCYWNENINYIRNVRRSLINEAVEVSSDTIDVEISVKED